MRDHRRLKSNQCVIGILIYMRLDKGYVLCILAQKHAHTSKFNSILCFSNYVGLKYQKQHKHKIPLYLIIRKKLNGKRKE